MNMVDFKWVLLFQLYYLVQNANSRQSGRNHKQVDSQSEENESEMEETTRRHHHRRKYRRPEDASEMDNTYRDNQVNTNNYEDECNNCACNKCFNPPDCCKAVCESCYQSRRLQYSGMPMQDMSYQALQMPQLQMPMPMPGMPMPGMAMMGMPIPGMPVPGVPMSLMQMQPSSPFGPGVVYLGVPPNLLKMLENESSSASASASDGKTTASTLREGTNATTTAATTTAATTTAATTTAATTTTTAATTTTTTQTTSTSSTLVPIFRSQGTMTQGPNIQRPALPCHSDKENNKRIALVLENAIDAFTKIIKAPDTVLPRRRNDNYMLPSPLRRTKSLSNNPPKYGVVQIPSNVAQRLLFQMRNAKDIRRTL